MLTQGSCQTGVQQMKTAIFGNPSSMAVLFFLVQRQHRTRHNNDIGGNQKSKNIRLNAHFRWLECVIRIGDGALFRVAYAGAFVLEILSKDTNIVT